VCCSVLQCATLMMHLDVDDCRWKMVQVVLQCVAACCSVLQRVAACCSVLQCVAVRCSLLQCSAVCCIVLQCSRGAAV